MVTNQMYYWFYLSRASFYVRMYRKYGGRSNYLSAYSYFVYARQKRYAILTFSPF